MSGQASPSATGRKPAKPPIRRDWWSKTLAGAVLGLSLALVCSGLFDALNPQLALTMRSQLAMWMVPPIWLGVLSLSFLFGSGLRAWVWLTAANALLITLLAALRATATGG